MTKDNEKLFIDFHVIQTVPPSCVNRDDTGSPKTAIYGGVRRARVSSQAWKRVMREMFKEHFDENELDVRTKKIVKMVADEIAALDPNSGAGTLTLSATGSSDALTLARDILNLAGVTTAIPKGKDVEEARALFFLSTQQAKNLAQLAISGKTDKKKAQAALNGNHGVGIALFGRMVADDPSLNADASAQVAHAISTHAVENEYDYYTAIDERSADDTAGAGMLGTIEFNSATLYRYGTVAAHELLHQLAGNSDALAKTISEFTRAFITSMPTGKQNTFANRSLPDAVLVTLRSDQPINFAGAFETPVKPTRDGGNVKNSIAALVKYAEGVYASFADAPAKAYVVTAGDELNALGEKAAVSELYKKLADEAKTRLVPK